MNKYLWLHLTSLFIMTLFSTFLLEVEILYKKNIKFFGHVLHLFFYTSFNILYTLLNMFFYVIEYTPLLIKVLMRYKFSNFFL